MTKFAVLIPVGPGPQELQRFQDALESLFYFEASCSHVVLIDDVPHSRQLDGFVKQIAAFHGRSPEIKVFVNPRKSRGEGWSGGMCVGVALGTRWISEISGIDFLLRIDADSLVIAPFADKVRSEFESNKLLGQLGTFRRYIDGTPRIKRDDAGLMAPFMKTFIVKRYGRKHLHFIITLWGRDRFRKRIIRDALHNDYMFGEFCQGGGYAVSHSMLMALKHHGFLDDICLFRDFYLGEDVVMSLLCYACGLKASDFNREGQPFGVEMGLPKTPKEMLNKGYAIIHSIKSADLILENSIRDYYRAFRKDRKIQ